MQQARAGARKIVAVVAAAAAAGSASVGLADDYGAYNGDNNLLWGVTHMSDFDQKRAASPPFIDGLPGDGSNYCVPTATMNVLAYIARHGYPNLEPGVMNWSSGDSGIYNDATANLALLGSLMGTGASSGTSSGGWSTGTFLWLASNGVLLQFDRYTRLAKNGQNVTTRRMAKTGLNGGLVMACYGRWNHDGIVLTSRSSGHCVTPIRIAASEPVRSELRYRDPATGGSSEISQSGIAVTTQAMVDEVFFAYGVPMILSRMDLQPPPTDGRWRIIDKYYTIFPKMGLTDVPDAPTPGLKLFIPTPLTPDFPREINIDIIGGAVTGLGQAPSRNFWAYVGAGGGAVGPAVYHIDPLTGQETMVGPVGVAGGLVFGRDERLYVLDRDRIRCYRPDDDDMLEPEVEIPIPAPHTSGAIAYDDETDEIIVLSVGSRSILRFPSGAPTALPAVQALPATVVLTPPVDVEAHTGGANFVMGDGSVHFLEPDPFSGRLIATNRYSPPPREDLRCISTDSNGHLFVNLGGIISELRAQDTGGYDVVPDSPFNGMRAGGCFSMSLSRTNFDPAVHDDPGWNTDLPADEAVVGTSTPDCPADWNADLRVDVFDLLAFLEDWFALSLEADLDANLTIDVFDLLEYLSLWFPGC